MVLIFSIACGFLLMRNHGIAEMAATAAVIYAMMSMWMNVGR